MTVQMFDTILVAAIVLATVKGWSRGLVVSATTLVGMVGGLFAARAILVNFPTTSGSSSLTRIGMYVLVGVITVNVSGGIGGLIGKRLRAGMTWRPVRRVDELGGAAVSFAAWATALWVFAGVLVATPVPVLPSLVGQSRAVAVVDTYMPENIRTGVEWLKVRIGSTHLPSRITAAFLSPPVALPAQSLTDASGVTAALSGVVRVEGTSSSCAMRMSGTGFVINRGLVLTNAHVIAGTDSVGVRVKGKGRLYPGEVVYIDRKTDVAVISVGNLKANPLRIGTQRKRGDGVIVAGFPGGGRLTLIPAGVRGTERASGTDIDGKGSVTRLIYALTADIRQGDSGAPLIAKDGSVVGVIFASSATDKTMGYALTPRELAGALDSKTSDRPVKTGNCIRDYNVAFDADSVHAAVAWADPEQRTEGQ